MQTGGVNGSGDTGGKREERGGEEHLTYRLCPVCLRAVPTRSPERFCVNDGARLLERCPACEAPITSPYARHCGECGVNLTPLPPTGGL